MYRRNKENDKKENDIWKKDFTHLKKTNVAIKPLFLQAGIRMQI
jgi:hypothetical protein